MFKNLILYRVKKDPMVLADFAAYAFEPCGAHQEKSIGWVPPRGQEFGALVETIGGHKLMKLMTETKAVPASVVKRGVDALAAEIEKSTGRKPGKKERREMADEVWQNCLPYAFTKQSATLIWGDTNSGLLAVDASSQPKADDAITMLLKAHEGLELQLLNTQTSPAAAMAYWLMEKEAPEDFSIDRECELKASDESKAVVKYGRHPLDIEEVAQHIRAGKLPTKLALTWNDRVSFVLTEGLQVKKLAILDVAFEESASKSDTAADNFDADMAITTGELSMMIPALIEALGGEAA